MTRPPILLSYHWPYIFTLFHHLFTKPCSPPITIFSPKNPTFSIAKSNETVLKVQGKSRKEAETPTFTRLNPPYGSSLSASGHGGDAESNEVLFLFFFFHLSFVPGFFLSIDRDWCLRGLSGVIMNSWVTDRSDVMRCNVERILRLSPSFE